MSTLHRANFTDSPVHGSLAHYYFEQSFELRIDESVGVRSDANSRDGDSDIRLRP